jgi:hypothetical protein
VVEKGFRLMGFIRPGQTGHIDNANNINGTSPSTSTSSTPPSSTDSKETKSSPTTTTNNTDATSLRKSIVAPLHQTADSASAPTTAATASPRPARVPTKGATAATTTTVASSNVPVKRTFLKGSGSGGGTNTSGNASSMSKFVKIRPTEPTLPGRVPLSFWGQDKYAVDAYIPELLPGELDFPVTCTVCDFAPLPSSSNNVPPVAPAVVASVTTDTDPNPTEMKASIIVGTAPVPPTVAPSPISSSSSSIPIVAADSSSTKEVGDMLSSKYHESQSGLVSTLSCFSNPILFRAFAHYSKSVKTLGVTNQQFNRLLTLHGLVNRTSFTKVDADLLFQRAMRDER